MIRHTTSRPLSVLVVGGGLSGMAAAIELDKRGAAVEILEKDPQWRTDGAGISLHGATLRVLKQLGVYEGFLKVGGGSNGFDILHPATDQTLATLPTPLIGDAPYGGAGIMRPALAELLREKVRAAGNIQVRLGHSLQSLAQDDTGVAATFSDGETVRYDLVVGADGVASHLRGELFPHAPEPVYVGQGVWRAVLDWPVALERPGMWINAKYKVGINKVSETRAYLFVTDTRPTLDFIPPESFESELRGILATFPSPVLHAIAAGLGPDSQILYRPLFRMLMPRPWSSGRVVMIGDAVHATTPHLAAGACAALEDAVVLAEELDRGRPLTEALAAYEDRRWPRCRMIVENSTRLCEIETQGGDREEHAQIMRASMMALAEAI